MTLIGCVTKNDSGTVWCAQEGQLQVSVSFDGTPLEFHLYCENSPHGVFQILIAEIPNGESLRKILVPSYFGNPLPDRLSFTGELNSGDSYFVSEGLVGLPFAVGSDSLHTQYVVVFTDSLSSQASYPVASHLQGLFEEVQKIQICDKINPRDCVHLAVPEMIKLKYYY